MLPHVTLALNHQRIWGPYRRRCQPFTVTLRWVRAEHPESSEVYGLRHLFSTAVVFCPDRLSAAVRTGIRTAKLWKLPPTQFSTKKKIPWLFICTPSWDFMSRLVSSVTNLTLCKLESQIQSDRNLAPLSKELIFESPYSNSSTGGARRGDGLVVYMQ